MDEAWRNFLYPIGFLANILFAVRFLFQWISSEKQKKSHLNSSFWMISLLGSLFLAIHSLIQIQYPVLIIQTCNVVLCLRNWQLIKYSKTELMPLRLVFGILSIVLVLTTAAFVFQSEWSLGHLEWMHIPNFAKSSKIQVAFGWTAVGFFGTFLFASRFWIHWWRAEKGENNPLKSDFWIISLVGSLLALSYFIRIDDYVNIIGYSAGMIPYIRNMLIMKRYQAEVN